MNEVTVSNDEFYVSYLDQPSEEANTLDMLCAMLGAPEPTGQSETALVIRPHTFYILYGDHREAYAKLAPQGLAACMDYFLTNIHLIGHSSEMPKVVSQ